MKSPLRVFRGLTLQRNDRKEEKKQHRPPMKLDELAQATQASSSVKSEQIPFGACSFTVSEVRIGLSSAASSPPTTATTAGSSRNPPPPFRR
ncbi:hypothetical protein Cni_G22690 [Canna indica]|uniref:Uncharacterized protein n=1 Tax=Canna indica TaxID=4628 RepID=A0AAQ3KT24_9LILI|nr:hypothetical protein Cni_G22690 [Canna indica]